MMTTGEKRIWAAAFAREYGVEMARQVEYRLATARAVRSAGDAVDASRNALKDDTVMISVQEGHAAMLREMIGEGGLPEPGTIVLTLDGDAWCAHNVEGHTDFSEAPSGVAREPGFTVTGRAGIFGAKDRGKFWKPDGEPDPLAAVREHVEGVAKFQEEHSRDHFSPLTPPSGWWTKLRELVGAKP